MTTMNNRVELCYVYRIISLIIQEKRCEEQGVKFKFFLSIFIKNSKIYNFSKNDIERQNSEMFVKKDTFGTIT